MKTSTNDFLKELYLTWVDRMAANPNLTVADYRGIFGEWEQATAEPEDVTYKTVEVGGVPAVKVTPIGCDQTKVLLFTHGGGFMVGSSTTHRKLAGHIAKEIGVSAIVLDYRLAPEHPFPAALEDVVTAYKALLEDGIKAEDITTIGDSAGGNLAVTSVLKLRELGIELPGKVIALSPWLNMELTGETLETNLETDGLIRKPNLEGMIAAYIGEDEEKRRNPFVNPLYADFTSFPPLYINAGGHEALLDDAKRLYERAVEHGVETTLNVVDGMQHVFPFSAGRAVEADEEIQSIAAWYKEN